MKAVATTLSILGLCGGALHAATREAAEAPQSCAAFKSLPLPHARVARAELIAAGAFPAPPPANFSGVTR